MDERDPVRAHRDVHRGVIRRPGHVDLGLDRFVLQVVLGQRRVDDALRLGDALGFFDADLGVASRNLLLSRLLLEKLQRCELLLDGLGDDRGVVDVADHQAYDAKRCRLEILAQPSAHVVNDFKIITSEPFPKYNYGPAANPADELIEDRDLANEQTDYYYVKITDAFLETIAYTYHIENTEPVLTDAPDTDRWVLLFTVSRTAAIHTNGENGDRYNIVKYWEGVIDLRSKETVWVQTTSGYDDVTGPTFDVVTHGGPEATPLFKYPDATLKNKAFDLVVTSAPQYTKDSFSGKPYIASYDPLNNTYWFYRESF